MINELRKLQLTELEILKEFARICKKHNLKYSLCGGTLLGAIRHKGFIPWDDDIDVEMPRCDYDFFESIVSNELQEKYLYQSLHNDKKCPYMFGKIRLKNSTLIEGSEKCKYTIQSGAGIYIDIFPIDRTPTSLIRRTNIVWFSQIVKIMLREKAYKESNGVIGLVIRMLELFVKDNSIIISKYQESMTKNSKNQTWKYRCLSGTTAEAFIEFDGSRYDNLVEVEFENCMFYAYKDYDYYLRKEYGDYMNLPPEDKRRPEHSPYLIDFQNSIDNYLKDKEISRRLIR